MIKEYGIKWEVLVGNHDIYYKNTNRVNTVDILEKLVGDVNLFEAINSPFIFDHILYVPWLNDENIEHTLSLVKDADYVFGHFQFAGYPMYTGMNSEHGTDHTIFKSKKVFSGHFHTVSEKDNVTYCGSPYHLTWSDEVDGTNRGFWILDTVTGDYKLIKNREDQTLFTRYEYDDSVDYNKNPEHLIDKVSGRIVKIYVNEKKNLKNFQAFIKLVNSCSIISVSIIDNTIVKVDKSNNEDEIDLNSSVFELIEKYCNNQAEIDVKVKEYIYDVYTRAKA